MFFNAGTSLAHFGLLLKFSACLYGVASEDGTLRKHDFREGSLCPPVGSSNQECRSVLVRSTLHLTHVTFSPNGEEVLLSYSGEHVYLMDVNHGGSDIMKYIVDDVSKQISCVPVLNREEIHPSRSRVFPTEFPRKANVPAELKKCKELVRTAEKLLKEGTNYLYGIEACNEVLDGNIHELGPELRHDCLCIRAALLLKWKNDVHMAIRDCNKARSINTSSYLGHYHMSEALMQLAKHKETLDFAFAAQCLAPSNSEAAERVQSIEGQLASADAEKSNKENDRAPKSGTGRVRSIADVMHRSEANSDASQDGPRSEREDSDYEEEMELDFETSISGFVVYFTSTFVSACKRWS